MKTVAALCLFAFGCASHPVPAAPSLRIDVAGQVIDRQFREVVVSLANTGAAAAGPTRLEVALPQQLPVIHESHDRNLILEKDGVSDAAHTYLYVVSSIEPGGRAVARFPFPRQGEMVLRKGEITVTAWNSSLPEGRLAVRRQGGGTPE